MYFRYAGLGLCSFIFSFLSMSNSLPRARSLVALKPSMPGVDLPLFSLVTLLIAFNKAELLLINCLCKSRTFFLSLFLLARYIRFCKLSTCRLTLYHLILFQSVASGSAGSQMLSFGVNLIISHHPLIVLYKYALYTRCIPFKSQPGYPCHSQWSA